jgi:hypothetical protein
VRRYLQFVAGVVVIALPAAVTLGLIVWDVLRVRAELDRYRHMFVTIPIGLDECVSLVVLIALTIAATILGLKLLDKARHPEKDRPISILSH